MFKATSSGILVRTVHEIPSLLMFRHGNVRHSQELKPWKTDEITVCWGWKGQSRRSTKADILVLKVWWWLSNRWRPPVCGDGTWMWPDNRRPAGNHKEGANTITTKTLSASSAGFHSRLTFGLLQVLQIWHIFGKPVAANGRWMTGERFHLQGPLFNRG